MPFCSLAKKKKLGVLFFSRNNLKRTRSSVLFKQQSVAKVISKQTACDEIELLIWGWGGTSHAAAGV